MNSIQERFKREPIHSLTTDPRLFKIYVIPYIYHRTVPQWDDVENPQALLDAVNYLQLMDFAKQFEPKRMPRAKPAPNFIEFAPEPTTFPEHKITFKLTPDYRFTYRPKSGDATFLEEHVNWPELQSSLRVSSSTTIGEIREKMLRTCLKFYHPDKEVYSDRLKFRKLKIIQSSSTTLLTNKKIKRTLLACIFSLQAVKENHMQPTSDTTAGKLSTNGGGNICHGLLYLQEFGCGVRYEINLCGEKDEKIQKLTAEKFNELKNELKCSYSSDVDIPRDLAEVIAKEKGTFTGKNYYEDKAKDQSDLQHAMRCVKDLYFNIRRSSDRLL